jgi:hypothetical protein
MRLSGEYAGLAITLEKAASALPPLAMSPRYAQHHPVDMTIACIDILEKILTESRKPNGQPPFRLTWWHPGWMEAQTKLIEHGSGGNSPPPRAFVTQASVAGNDVA